MKFKLVKIISLILALLMLSLTFFGCKGEKAGDDTTADTSDSGETSNEESNQTNTDVVIASNGESDFTIYLAQEFYTNSEMKTKISEMCALIKRKTGAELKLYSDRSAKDDALTAPAILIGPTKFEESKSSDAVLRTEDFIIEYVGNKIILYSPFIEGCKNAVDYFHGTVVSDQKVSDKTLYLKQEYLGKKSNDAYAIDSILCCGEELTSYRIVLPQNATTNESFFAYQLRYHLYSSYGYELEVVTDASPVSEREILVGNTSRKNITAENGKFSVKAEENKLFFVANDMCGYESMFEYATQTLIVPNSEKKCTVEGGFLYVGDTSLTLEEGTRFITERSGDARVMFYNVYGYDLAGGPNVRQPFQKELVANLAPSVLGLQEASSAYNTSFALSLAELGYTRIETSAGNANFTPIFYKEAEVTLLKSGYQLYSNTNDNSKGLTWAVFKDNDTQKTFAVINTHFMWNRPSLASGEANTIRVSNATELIGVKNAILDEYENIPVIAGGDLNSKVNGDPHTVLTDGGMSSAYSKADVKNNVSGRTSYAIYDGTKKCYTQWSNPWGLYSDALDHAYVSENVNVNTFAFVYNLYGRLSSDHMPVLVDITL